MKKSLFLCQRFTKRVANKKPVVWYIDYKKIRTSSQEPLSSLFDFYGRQFIILPFNFPKLSHDFSKPSHKVHPIQIYFPRLRFLPIYSSDYDYSDYVYKAN